jgi:hypothetical protein
MVASTSFCQQWNDEHLVGPGLGRGNRLAFHLGANGRMQDRFEPGACGGVAEDDLAQPTPVEPAVGIEYVAAEGLGDGSERRLAGFDDLARYEVNGTPWVANRLATVVLPLAMPPVRATRKGRPVDCGAVGVTVVVSGAGRPA